MRGINGVGRNHVLFNLPMFQSVQFEKFVEKMRQNLSSTDKGGNSKIETVLPGLLCRIDKMNSNVSHVQQMLIKNTAQMLKREDLKDLVKRNDLKNFMTHIASYEWTDTSTDSNTETSTCREIIVRENSKNSQSSSTASTVQQEPYKIFNVHTNILGMYQEFYGLGPYNSLPGGMNSLEKKHKGKGIPNWRKHFSSTDAKIFQE